MKRYLLLLVTGLLISSGLFAQQLGRRTQFMFNPYLVNPAVAGTKNYTPIMMSFRNQWAGFEGAPKTYTVSGHASLPHNIGVGGILYSDNTGGAISRTGLELTGAYKVDLTNEDQISFALSPVIGQYKFNNDSLVYYDPNDQALLGGLEKNMTFDANFGMLVYGTNYMFGFSIPNLMQAKLKLENNSNGEENQFVRHYYFMGSYKYYLSDNFDIQPSVLTKFTAVTPVQFDINVKGTYQDMIWAGIGYRHRDAIAIMLGAEYLDFTLGYAYEITTTDARNFSPHTHELTVGYNIPRANPRFKKGRMNGRIVPRKKIFK